MYWKAIRVRPPCTCCGDDVQTAWTTEGKTFYDEHKTDDPPAILEPGKHYVLVEPLPADYIAYPNIKALARFRHEWVMRRNLRPHVPALAHAPLPHSGKPQKERGRLFSIYLRPWALSPEGASHNVL